MRLEHRSATGDTAAVIEWMIHASGRMQVPENGDKKSTCQTVLHCGFLGREQSSKLEE